VLAGVSYRWPPLAATKAVSQTNVVGQLFGESGRDLAFMGGDDLEGVVNFVPFWRFCGVGGCGAGEPSI
jgi:hypothetical protein